jgi:hypothetical protein
MFHTELNLSGIALLAIAAVAAWNVSLGTESSELSSISLANVEALAECEDTVERSGGIIIVTVCERKTPWYSGVMGVSCSKSATTSCQFSNVCP